MANFTQHLTGGITAGIITSSIAFSVYQVDISQVGVVFILTVLGSLLPDIDSDTSTPLKFLLGYVGVLLPIVCLEQFVESPTMEIKILVVVIGYFFLRDIASQLFLKLTRHRGVFHSIPMAIIVGQCVFFLFYDSSFDARVLFSCAVTIGFCVHLIMDELWSVNLMGVSMKKSFGSAFKLTGGSHINTVIIYAALVFLGYMIMLEI